MIAKINLNGTLENYITFTQDYNWGKQQCGGSYYFSIANMSAIQYLVNDECDIHDKDGNQISFSFMGIITTILALHQT